MTAKKLILFLLFLLLTPVVTLAQSTMTDKQVLEYTKKAMAAGKDQKTIATELAARGVDRTQAARVKKLYEKSELESQQKGKTLAVDTLSRKHKSAEEAETEERPIKEYKKEIVSSDKVDKLNSFLNEEEDALQTDSTDSMEIFGYNIFHSKKLNFAPSENLATPRNYRLGAGDEVIVDIYGANQVTLRRTISPEGSINVDVLGPLYLNGMTIEEANKYLKKKLSSIYAGLNRSAEGTDITLSLGEVRSIQINVMGDVMYPGTYTMSSFSTTFHALYMAGGIKEPGSLRYIKVSRGGKVIANVDIYEFLMNGTCQGDIRLEEGDVILVPPYKSLVQVTGKVKRPMFFEMKEDENMSKLLEYAGGFAKGAYTNNITVVRQTGKDYEVCTVDEMDYSVFKMKDGDEVKVDELLSRFENRVSIKGAVYRTGIFQLDSETNTIKSLIAKADGLMPEAFVEHAVLSREKDDKSLEVQSVDVKGIMDGSAPDVALRKNDELYIPSKYDLNDQGTLSISGEVANPGTFVYASNMTLEDLIIRAGGLLQSASTVRADVSRRVKNPSATTAQKEIAQLFTFSVKDNYVIDGQVGFELQPYDQVFIRRSPSYNIQQNVTVSGEANFAGTYPLTVKEERISELLRKAGGATEYAYLKGARLVRRVNEQELIRMKTALEASDNPEDSIAALQLNLSSTYNVGIDLDKAVANPGSSDDVVLREGDELVIPVFSNTIRIDGCVLSPNEVAYQPGKTVKYYIRQAGGYANRAKRSKTYVVSMNGHIKKGGLHTKVEPGSEVIVPMKAEKIGNGLQNVLGVATTAASLGTMAATIANIIK